MQAIDLVVFDVDGVLVDVSRSWPQAVRETVRRLTGEQAPPVTEDEISALKAAGGFNDDWDVAAAAIWSRRAGIAHLAELAVRVRADGGGLERLCAIAGLKKDPGVSEIAATAAEIYAGSARVEEMFGMPAQLQPPENGLWQLEEALIAPEDLLLLPVPKALYTGRMMGELSLALERFRLSVFFPDHHRLTSDGPFRKPDGGGLVYLARSAGAQSVLMVGDNVDDIRAAKNAQSMDPDRSYTFCAVPGALGDRSREIFEELGADAIAPSAKVLLEWLRAR